MHKALTFVERLAEREREREREGGQRSRTRALTVSEICPRPGSCTLRPRRTLCPSASESCASRKPRPRGVQCPCIPGPARAAKISRAASALRRERKRRESERSTRTAQDTLNARRTQRRLGRSAHLPLSYQILPNLSVSFVSSLASVLKSL